MPRKGGETSRARLLEAAERLFAERGVKGTTVSAIVAEAGLTQAAFYLYFRSKEAMVEALVNRFGEMLDRYTDAGRQAEHYPPEQLRERVTAVFVGLFELLGRNANLTRVVLQDTEAGERYRNRIVAQIAGNMRRNRSLGIVDAGIEPEIAAEAIVAAVERLVFRYVMAGGRTAEELGRHTAHLFLNGLLPDGGPADGEGARRT
jgi:AcrR family transcriptional regulator